MFRRRGKNAIITYRFYCCSLSALIHQVNMAYLMCSSIGFTYVCSQPFPLLPMEMMCNLCPLKRLTLVQIQPGEIYAQYAL